MILIPTVVAEVRPGNERGGSVLVRVIVRICYGAILPRKFVWRGGKRRVVVLGEQLTGGRCRAKGIIVIREGVKVEAKFCSADAVCLSGEVEVVDVVFGGGGGSRGVEHELLFLGCLSLRFCLSGGDHYSSCGDDGVGRATSPLWK